MAKPHKKSAGAGPRSDGNVVLDLGEKHSEKIQKMIDSKFAQAGLAGGKTEIGRPPLGLRSGSRFGGRFLGRPAIGRPALGAGYRPWFAGRRPWMGQQEGALAVTPRGMFQIIPTSIKEVVTAELLTGVGLGILGNRALLRLSNQLWKTNTNKMVHEGIAFAAGLIPLLFKQNASTLGVAIPGAVFLGGSLVDMLFDAVGMPKSTLAGAEPGRSAGADAALAARQKLAAIQQRIQTGGQPGQRAVPRVFAQAQ